MKVGFIADTHGYYEDTKKAMDILKDCENIVHLGDILAHGPRNPIQEGYDPIKTSEVLRNYSNVTYTRGNCDADVDEMVLNRDIMDHEEMILLWGKFPMFAYHSHKESLQERIEQAEKFGAKLIAIGHTHVKKFDVYGELAEFCPGSAALPKDGTKSVAIFDNEIGDHGAVIFYNVDTGEEIERHLVPENKTEDF